ncbi:TetR/AcrR family transcriptional regulator [Fodinicola feengrottensis]|uniref:TetR/AcrR family transcriptional regulator n=1 Tax=Fodinicola feengrottensis TaxID=435914 RepID=A0ABP4RNQ6_9ACTN|nr:helix-turn-helix domain containing protein [Fodinicola feengrottensis]
MTESTEPIGRRERKKAQTRQALADAALRLFLERGYDHVSVKEIADAADVSVTTLFKHFSGKEALVFDQAEDIEAELVSAVRDRRPGQSIPQSLCDHMVRSVHGGTPEITAFLRMVDGTPVLRDYAHRMWMRHETAVAQAIAAEVGAPDDDVRCVALAHFALEARHLIKAYDDPRQATREIFALLDDGWSAG